jgi:hypothetical protein
MFKKKSLGVCFVLFLFLVGIVSAEEDYSGGDVYGTLADGTPDWSAGSQLYGGIKFTYDAASVLVGYIRPQIDVSSYVTSLIFGLYTGSSVENIMVLNGSTGYVGIGTGSPKQKLEVNGSVNVTSGNVTVDSGKKMCFDQTCSSYIWNNGTNLQIVG